MDLLAGEEMVDYASSSDDTDNHVTVSTSEVHSRPAKVLKIHSRRSQRLIKDAMAKRMKIANETAEEREERLKLKRETNKRYFEKETPEQKADRLHKKSVREKRQRLDILLQSFHPDLLATVNIQIIKSESGGVEMRVPWALPPDETEEEVALRYYNQEVVINKLIASETPEMKQHRALQVRAVKGPRKSRTETAADRLQRMQRQREQTRLRRLNESAEHRLARLEAQRLRTQKIRDEKVRREMAGEVDEEESNTMGGGRKAKAKKERVRTQRRTRFEIVMGVTEDEYQLLNEKKEPMKEEVEQSEDGPEEGDPFAEEEELIIEEVVVDPSVFAYGSFHEVQHDEQEVEEEEEEMEEKPAFS